MPNRNINYGWRRDPPDCRDYPFEKLVRLKSFETQALPDHVYLRRFCSEVTDQGALGSCTANAITNLLEYNLCAAGLGGPKFKDMSRLFLYYNERKMEGTVSEDSGATLRDGVKALADLGICAESDWPYVVEKFANEPGASCYQAALVNRIHSYYSMSTLNQLRASLANGHPFVFGFMVYDGFESDKVARTGVVDMPGKSEQLLGGHAVMAMGYNDAQRRFLIKNSWGKRWGLPNPALRGYFTIPYDYLADPNLASDFWTIVKDA